MLPANLHAAHFAKYPPQARAVAVAHISLLRQLPLSFLPSLLRELIDYDYSFPAERMEMDRQLAYLTALSAAQLADCFRAFDQIKLTPELSSADWCGHPLDFTEQLSAYLWRTHQMNAFRSAATVYGDTLHAALLPEPLPLPRLGIAVIGQGASPQADVPLFRKLHEHGTLFTNVDPENGLSLLLAAVTARARLHPAPYAHWYVDGGSAVRHDDRLTGVSYGQLVTVRTALLENIQREVGKKGMGPEELRDHLTHLVPADLGMKSDALLDRFQLKILTEGSGTQIFSTTFAQWTAREALRRAEALTLLVRFAPRQRQRPMNELLSNDTSAQLLDPQGSLIDADMAAYYHWINQQRLPGSQQSSFIAWFEGQRQAVAIGPSLPRQTESGSAVNLQALLSLVSG